MSKKANKTQQKEQQTDTRVPIRHGEILLVPVTNADMTGAVKKTDYIVGHSETGHHHVIQGDCLVLERAGTNTLLQIVGGPKTLTHTKADERHNDVPVAEGIWEKIQKQSYDPISETMQEVRD